MSEYSLKEIAIMKKEFLNSEFGKYAAGKINELYGQHHSKAELFDLEPWKKAAHADRAAGVAEVISFFTSDVDLLEGGYFNKPEEKTKP